MYFVEDDLYQRLTTTANWIALEAIKIVENLKYSGRTDTCRMHNLSFVVACLEAAECYTPITTSTEDGIVNCLTEVEIENIFSNIASITGLVFPPKGTSYGDIPVDDNNQFGEPTLNSGGPITLHSGLELKLNKLKKEL